MDVFTLFKILGRVWAFSPPPPPPVNGGSPKIIAKLCTQMFALSHLSPGLLSSRHAPAAAAAGSTNQAGGAAVCSQPPRRIAVWWRDNDTSKTWCKSPHQLDWKRSTNVCYMLGISVFGCVLLISGWMIPVQSVTK